MAIGLPQGLQEVQKNSFLSNNSENWEVLEEHIKNQIAIEYIWTS